MPFVSLGLSPTLAQPLARLGFSTPTPIQELAIPLALNGRDLLARAQTGTGKTAAFGLPLIQHLTAGGPRTCVPRQPKGLVLVPTRELAQQVSDALQTYGLPVKLRVTVVVGGVSMHRQVVALHRGVDVVIATPGRLLDHLERRSVDLTRITALVLDEADRMLDMGFLPALRRILAVVPEARQTMLFSATLSADVRALAKTFTREAESIDVTPTANVASTVSHRLVHVTNEDKRAALTHLLKAPDARQTLVFCRTKHGSNRVGRYLETVGVAAAVIHGDKSQNARTRALTDFKNGRIAVLVATDVAARGLDIQQLPLVINYDLPLVAEDYVHRVGRTGRAGVPGCAVSLATRDEAPLLREIKRLVSSPLELVAIPGLESPSAALFEGPAAGAPAHSDHGARAGRHRPAGFDSGGRPQRSGSRGGGPRPPQRSRRPPQRGARPPAAMGRG